MFSETCNVKNEIKNSPESAIATFLAIDEFNSPDFAITMYNWFKSATKIQLFQKNHKHLNLIYIQFKQDAEAIDFKNVMILQF